MQFVACPTPYQKYVFSMTYVDFSFGRTRPRPGQFGIPGLVCRALGRHEPNRSIHWRVGTLCAGSGGRLSLSPTAHNSAKVLRNDTSQWSNSRTTLRRKVADFRPLQPAEILTNRALRNDTSATREDLRLPLGRPYIRLRHSPNAGSVLLSGVAPRSDRGCGWGVSPQATRGQDARATAGKMPALRQIETQPERHLD